MFFDRAAQVLMDECVIHFGNIFHCIVFKQNINALVLGLVGGVAGVSCKNEIIYQLMIYF